MPVCASPAMFNAIARTTAHIRLVNHVGNFSLAKISGRAKNKIMTKTYSTLATLSSGTIKPLLPAAQDKAAIDAR